MPVYRGRLLEFDDTAYRARVRIDGAAPRTVDGVRCSRLYAVEFVPGRRVLIDTGDHNDPEDAVVVAVWE